MGVFYIQKPKKLKSPPPKPKAPPKPPAQKASDKLKTKKKKAEDAKRKSNRGTDKRYNPYGQGSSANPSNMSARSGG